MTESRVYTIIGLMSGTSMDGVDAAILETDGQNYIRPGATHFMPYVADFRARLRAVLSGVGDVTGVTADLTKNHIAAIEQLLTRENIPAGAIDYIGFHGHTILHDPKNKKTWQIGDAQMMADHFKIPVVHDFRSADVLAGGQGAPLVPTFHAALAAQLPKPVAFVNVGGVANITYIDKDGRLLAFDTGPGNALMDDFVFRILGQSHDPGGLLAAKGRSNDDMIESWMEQGYFKQKPPKSLDREHFQKLIAECAPKHTSEKSGYDFIATLTEFTAHSIARSCLHLPRLPQRWLITGGGRHNATLMRMIEESLVAINPLIRVEKIESIGWDGDFIEAWAFAYLAARSVLNLPISFPETTGVKQAMGGGKITDQCHSERGAIAPTRNRHT